MSDSTLNFMSAQEISDLLDEYGVKHGPIVASTRSLYEKKLKEAMANTSKKQSPDKTYYREEEDEITYVRFRAPVRNEGFGDCNKQLAFDHDQERDEHLYEPVAQQMEASYGNVSHTKLMTTDKAATWTRSTADKSINWEQSTADRTVAYNRAASDRTMAWDVSTATTNVVTPQRGVPVWIRFLVFLALAVFLYYVYTCMETSDVNPFTSD